MVSGFAASSTTKALPVPTCVILTKSAVLDPDAIIRGLEEPAVFTERVLPSNVMLLSTVALGADPSSVIIPLSVVPVKDNTPDVPELPEDPDVPEDPDAPEDPDVPEVPLDPDVPLYPNIPKNNSLLSAKFVVPVPEESVSVTGIVQ